VRLDSRADRLMERVRRLSEKGLSWDGLPAAPGSDFAVQVVGFGRRLYAQHVDRSSRQRLNAFSASA
jgi:hypothetical protein